MTTTTTDHHDDQELTRQVWEDLQYHLSIRNGEEHHIDDQNSNDNNNDSVGASTSPSSPPSGLKLLDSTAMAIPVAAMKTLLNVVQRSKSETMMGLQHELQQASKVIMNYNNKNYHNRDHPDNPTSTRLLNTPSSYSISLQSGIELFLIYITRSYLETPNFNDCRLQVLQRGQQFQQLSSTARDRIAGHTAHFIPHNATILTIGFSRVVAAILYEASKTKHFHLIVMEGGGGGDLDASSSSSTRTAQCYGQEMNIPVTVIPDAAVGYIMEERNVSMVLVGSYVIVENGGLFNKCGTFTTAMCAYTMNIPFYVAAESYKFARLYPLHQSDIPYNEDNNQPHHHHHDDDDDDETPLPGLLHVRNPRVDYTPAKYITLFFTDLGTLTTSAVSDELIRLYQ